MFNLLDERWLPVIRADGSLDRIAPWELASGEPPPMELAPPPGRFPRRAHGGPRRAPPDRPAAPGLG